MNDLDFTPTDFSGTNTTTTVTALVKDTFLGDNSTTDFVLSETPNAEPNDVFLNGMLLPFNNSKGFSYIFPTSGTVRITVDGSTYTPTSTVDFTEDIVVRYQKDLP